MIELISRLDIIQIHYDVELTLESILTITLCFSNNRRLTMGDDEKQAEIDRKKAEVRARLEAQAAGKKAKKGFMTPERKKKLRVCNSNNISRISPGNCKSDIQYKINKGFCSI